LPTYGTACNDSCHSREDMFLHEACTRNLLHSPCHKDLWLSSYSFCFSFYYFCASHYNMSSTILFSSHDAYFLLSTTCLHSPPTCTCHCNSQMCYHAWETFHTLQLVHLHHYLIYGRWCIFNIWSSILFVYILLVSLLLCYSMACVFVFLFALYLLWIGPIPIYI